MSIATKPWRPEYGYRRSKGWRQKILHGSVWKYPAENVVVRPTILSFYVHPSRRWKTLFFLKAFGLKNFKFDGEKAILAEVPDDICKAKALRFLRHVRRSNLKDQKIGLPGVRLSQWAESSIEHKS